MTTTHLFRYYDGSSGDSPPYLVSYPVLRFTPRGFVIDVYGKEKFVLSGIGKRFAFPSIEEAQTSYIARKRRHVAILAAQHDNAVENLRRAKAGEWDYKPWDLTFTTEQSSDV